MTRYVSVSEAPIFPDQILKFFSEKNFGSGGIVSFSGHVRVDAQHGGTRALYLQAHEPLTSQKILNKRQEALSRWDLDDAYIAHRIGEMLPGEAIVFVVTAAKHRRDAFLAADFLMDYLKTDAFFWKKEIGQTGERWIEPRQADYEDASRWQSSPDIKKAKDK